MGKLTPQQRRRLAISKQFEKLTFKQLRARGYTVRQITRWQNIDATGPDVLFRDDPCGHPPPKLTDALKRRIMRRLERDDLSCVARAAEQFHVSVATVRRVGNELGGQVSRHREVHISSVHRLKRVAYSEGQIGDDHTKKCWVDHMKVTIPCEPTRQRVWRARDSRKPVPRALRWKQKINFLVLVAVCSDAISAPVFAVNKVRRKRARSGETTRGYRYETYTIDEQQMRQDITEHVFPFMEEHGLTELILDNASCQDGLAQWIRDQGYSTPGFASARRNHDGGYPPNSPDCMANDATLFARAKVLLGERGPKTIPQAISALKAIFRSLQGVQSAWIAHLDDLHQEIIDADGGPSHHMQH